ncbi:D-alanyl-D-alanine carboxypeptidase family protein [Paenibacillus sediminis]|uniref:D-alanyl-D-alanine carboxypeptidase n=1 Tax=Paenibacillus sediminis TaxID=664909 RepID=A0ABS4H0C6_9BACL|nr:D-alanyl-D-alanine carboxypeptidase family protein [Paenibacillus sediminis]MBP1935817.1 D-alanyl-D-alanine carboxypeptidase [Paenibacillus sediminis]
MMIGSRKLNVRSIRWLLCFVLMLVFTSESMLKSVYAEPVIEEPTLTSESAVLMDMETGTVLYSKNAEKEMYPASITKIVTAIVALENSSLDDVVTVTKDARNEDGTRIYLEEGEQKTMRELLYGMMLNSGNDAATAIAEHIDGTKERFADRMNQFVRDKAGATHSQFRNPNGLPDPEHYTTALDMANIARYAMKNPVFREIVSTKTMPWEGKEWKSMLSNHNKMLWNYEGATGIKNGYTQAAGQTLVTSAKRNGMELIGVVLNAPSSEDVYSDMTKLLDYGFNHFEVTTIFNQGDSYTSEVTGGERKYKASEMIRAVVPMNGAHYVDVDSDGNVNVTSSIGTIPAGRLDPIAEEPAGLATAKNAGTSSSNGWMWAVWFVWLLYIALLVLAANKIIKKRRASKMTYYSYEESAE